MDAEDVYMNVVAQEVQEIIDFTIYLNVFKPRWGAIEYDLITEEREIETVDMMGNFTGNYKNISQQFVIYKNKKYSIVEFRELFKTLY